VSVKGALKKCALAGGLVAASTFGVWAWATGVRRRPTARDVRRILVIRLDLMGDVVFSLPAIELLAEQYPEATVDVLVLPYTAPLLRGVAHVRRIHTLDVNQFRRPSGWRRAAELIACIRSLRAQRYDLAIGLSGLMGGVFAALSGARWRAGYAAETLPGCYNLRVPGRRYREAKHEVMYCVDLVRAIAGGPARDVAPRLSPATPERPPASPYMVLVPGANNGRAKRWPPAYWAALADALATTSEGEIVLAGSESEGSLAREIATLARCAIVNRAGQTSVDELVSLLAGARVVVAGDTGPLHVAAALGRPVVGIFGPTDPVNTGPLGSASTVVRLGLTCSPCYDLRSPADCKLPDRSTRCMWGLDPSTVEQAVRNALATAPSAAHG